MITAHPVAAAVAGITALTIAIYELTLEMKNQKIAECFGDISISFEKIAALTDPISGGIDKVADAFAENKSKLETAKDNFKEIATAVQETMDSFKSGENDGSVQSFAQQLDEFIDSALGVNNAVTDTSALEALYASDGKISEAEQKSLTFWVKIDSTGLSPYAQYRRFIWWSANNAYRGLEVSYNGSTSTNVPSFVLTGGVNGGNASSAINDGTWHSITIVQRGGRNYHNG